MASPNQQTGAFDQVAKPTRNPQDTKDVTVSHVLGEITWLMSQSRRHSSFSIADLAWFAMPPIAGRQFHLFRDGGRPVGVALWGFPPPAAEERLAKALPSPANPLGPGDWTGGANLWLVDLIAPFATVENRQVELMLGDLMIGPLKGREFRMLRLDPVTGAGSAAVITADAGQRLISEIAAALPRGQMQ
jgi:cytolysin-activating lysine-acyltransferase